MDSTESKQLVSEIINKAREGKSLEFHLIIYWSEFRYYGRLAKANKLIIKTLRSSAKKLFKNYRKDVIAGISEVDKLLAYSQLLDIISFYEQELSTIKQMLDEYDEYLGQGHFWHAFLGGQRDIWNFN